MTALGVCNRFIIISKIEGRKGQRPIAIPSIASQPLPLSQDKTDADDFESSLKMSYWFL
ncbi:hypothetical protein H6G52_02210 [Limnothrix sp. FACHB-881]|uniref:hypothetical protein n=1 Tax=unclassified Limnothrix TaxID=2632864 RepID=UPI001683C273|nr:MULTISPECIES: hypothetical protein [unclassified Limnothrix]MBD2552525.1 hypothetical protein [Limnothrix sp. FACHB-708]MBD2590391.1 hypothetical protein [Limnothrix sp. FACHB-406]MBD2634164.1 hypothetical protein [Limnothrix sp. FACHB-881]